MHPWIVRGVGVHKRATVIDSYGAQFEMPGFVSVDLAQPVLGAMLGQPRRGNGGPDVDRVPRHVSRRVGGGHPADSFLFRAVLRDRLIEELSLVLRGTPAALDEDLDSFAPSICCGLAEGTEESWIKVGHGRVFVIEYRHALRDDTVSLAKCAMGLAVKTVVWAVLERPRGDGRGRRWRRCRQGLVTEPTEKCRADDDKGAEDGRSCAAGSCPCWLSVGHASSQGSVVLSLRMRFSICRRYVPAGSIANMRVLIVEDEPYMAEAIRDGLRLEAIAADIAGDGDTALELLTSNAYDIAVLDRDIPGPSGDQIAERIVASGSGMPILMLTAADRLDDKATGFELGADDYLTKPFELRELVLRLRALDRRRAHNRPPVREIAGLRLDPFRREVYRDGRYVALTRKQFAVLEVLVAAEGGVVSAEELLERAWDENADPFTNAVRITVSGLRKRLGEPWIIATVAGVGYRIDSQPGTGCGGGDRG
jgi:two-component system, OmpR family, response regulator VanR